MKTTQMLLALALALTVSACGKDAQFDAAPALAAAPTAAAKPVSCDVYDLGYYPTSLPLFANLTPTVTVGLNKFSLGLASGDAAAYPALVGTEAEAYKKNVAFRCKGTLTIAQGGANVIKVTSDDGVRVTLGGVKIIENNTSHGATANSATVTLDAGTYSMVVEYFNGNGDKQLNITTTAPVQTSTL